jgi:hypothetical protein
VRRALNIAAGILFALSSGCGPRDLIDVVRDPTPGHIAYILLVVPLLWIAQEIAGEAVGALLGALLPPWMKTRRALWTAVAVASLVTVGAVIYWNLAGRR